MGSTHVLGKIGRDDAESLAQHFSVEATLALPPNTMLA
jgi:hypothetical protein